MASSCVACASTFLGVRGFRPVEDLVEGESVVPEVDDSGFTVPPMESGQGSTVCSRGYSLQPGALEASPSAWFDGVSCDWDLEGTSGSYGSATACPSPLELESCHFDRPPQGDSPPASKSILIL